MRGFFRNLFKTEAPEPTDRRQDTRVDATEGLRILVVDDSATVVAVLGRMLNQARYQAYSADSGEAALESLNTSIPDLIFLDIVLPGMSGFAALRALRRDPRTAHVPVIMISGNLKATEEFYGQRIGADDFMKKPFGRTEVFTRIQRLVESGRLQRRELPVDHGDLLLDSELLAEETVPSDHLPPDASEFNETAQPDEQASAAATEAALIEPIETMPPESPHSIETIEAIAEATPEDNTPGIVIEAGPESVDDLESRTDVVDETSASTTPDTYQEANLADIPVSTVQQTPDVDSAIEPPPELIVELAPVPTPDAAGLPNESDADVIEPPAPIAIEETIASTPEEPAPASTPDNADKQDDEALHPALRPEVRDPDSKVIYSPSWERD